MNIAINTRLLLPDRLDGIGWFTYEVCKRMVREHPEHRFFFLFDRKYDPEFIFSDNVVPVVLPPPARHPFLWIAWLEISVHRFLKKNNIEVFVSPDGFIPLRSEVPCLPVVHDINFFHRPGDLPFFNRLYYNFFFPRFVKRGVRVGTVSHFSAGDVVRSYHISDEKIDVCHNGVNESYGPLEEGEIQKIRDDFSQGDPYFIFIGTLHPRKNVSNLLKSYDRFRGMTASKTRLVIVGEKLFMTKDMEKTFREMKFSDQVIFTGRLKPHALKRILGAARAMTFIPYFEGFGIPLAEAMKCGVPVIASNVTSLPEVGGEAALYADPDKLETIADLMKQLDESSELRQRLREQGLKRVKRFNWDHTAEKLWESIEKIHGETKKSL